VWPVIGPLMSRSRRAGSGFGHTRYPYESGLLEVRLLFEVVLPSHCGLRGDVEHMFRHARVDRPSTVLTGFRGLNV
jgi:hypothetical protein